MSNNIIKKDTITPENIPIKKLFIISPKHPPNAPPKNPEKIDRMIPVLKSNSFIGKFH